MDQYSRFKNGSKSIEERLLISKVVSDAAKEANAAQKEVAVNNHLYKTGFLQKSIQYSVAENRMELLFAKYLRFIDMGSGSEKEQERKKIPIYNSIVWYYKGRITDRLYRSLTNTVINEMQQIEDNGSN